MKRAPDRGAIQRSWLIWVVLTMKRRRYFFFLSLASFLGLRFSLLDRI
ncbi:MAG: hypothetical protein QM759_00220 [Terricaulis sp.]